MGYDFKYNFISYDYLQYSIFIFCWIKVVNKQTSWSSANSTCELAGFRLSGPVSPEQIPVDSALPEQSFWIGALSHHTPWFQVYSKLMFIWIHVIDSVFLLLFFGVGGEGGCCIFNYRLIHLNNKCEFKTISMKLLKDKLEFLKIITFIKSDNYTLLQLY